MVKATGHSSISDKMIKESIQLINVVLSTQKILCLLTPKLALAILVQ